MDRKLTLETIEKMKQPKTVEHKKKISKSITNWWEDRKQKRNRSMALLDSKQLNPKLTGSFILSGSTQTFIGASVFSGSADITGSVTASGDISGSYNIYWFIW